NKTSYFHFTCDMLAEGIDFTLKHDPYLIGRKAIAVSLSDISACAGIPRYCLISLGLPKNTTIKFTNRLFKGMLSMAQEYKLNIVGGDLSKLNKVVIDISILGIVEKNRLVSRNGAKTGDIICVSGELGGSMRGRHLKFTPRIKEARFLSAKFKIKRER
ncbi:MAG: thiamine-phosphate kinase, partial [Candidatus Woesearchaeota archaeon]